jgi:large-conductance mechanosensitive channel
MRIHVNFKTMSTTGLIVKNTFNKVFNNLAKELVVPVEEIQIAIYYEEKKQKYAVYHKNEKKKDFDIGNYIEAVIDWSGGTALIENTIAQGGTKYAKEYESEIDAIKIVMIQVKDSFPRAVLLVGGEKKRPVNIEEEFLQ